MGLPSDIAAQLGPWGAVAFFLFRDLLGVLRSLRAQGERIGKLEDRVSLLEGRTQVRGNGG